MTRMLVLLLALSGCGPAAGFVPAEVDPATWDLVADVLGIAQPEPWLEGARHLESLVPSDESCPTLSDVSDADTQRFDGGCLLEDGAFVWGSLVHHEDYASTWVSGDHYSVADAAGVRFGFDGAITVDRDGDMLFVDAAFAACGGPAFACDEGLTTVDLAYTVYPAGSFPGRYDLTVRGVVEPAGDDAVRVQGTWSIDETACELEPIDGLAVIDADRAYSLEFDGTCDGCARAFVDGLAAQPACRSWLE
jgi:hypothetical protein